MKRIICLILFLTFCNTLLSQESPNYSFEFKEATLLGAIQQVEKETGYRFYFLNEWTANKTVNGNFENVSLPQLLNLILKETSLNYFIIENRIILTLGSFVISELPSNFFETRPEANDTNNDLNVEPVFYGNTIDNSQKIETVVIGKQGTISTKKSFTLTGKVTNKKTSEPLNGLTVILQGRDNVVAVTDINGNYSIQLNKGANTIIAKALGIEPLTKRVVIYKDGTLNLSVEESFEVLGEVVVKADADANVKKTVTGHTKIEIKEIKNIPLVLGERDILKVATTLPGITTAGEGAAGYNVRGGKTDQNLILLDGAVIYNPQHFFGIFSAINPFTSGDAQIYKGSIPARYGGRLSSVFEINTKEATITENLKGEVSIGPVTGNITLEAPVVKDKSGILVGARGSYANWILKTIDDPTLNNTEASFYDVILKYNHKLNQNNNLNVTGYHSSDRFNITIDSLYSYTNTLASAVWGHKFTDNTKSKLTFAHSRYNFGIEFEGRSNTNFDFGFNLNETELRYGIDKILSKKNRLNFGISTKLYGINPGEISPKGNESEVENFAVKREQGLESAAFISNEFTVTEKLSVDAGVRFSMFSFLGETQQRTYLNNQPKNNETATDTLFFGKNDFVKTYGGPEVRVSGRYLLSPSLSLKAGYNSTLQYIHTLSNNTTASPVDTWKLSDTHLEPQRGQQFSLGVYKNFVGNLYEFSVEGYYKKLENVLDYKVGGQLLLNEFVETEVLQGDGKAYGVEVLLKKNEGRLNGWLGYTFSRSFVRLNSSFPEEQVNGGNFFPSNFDKPHDVSMVLNYKFTKRISVSGNFVYQTGRPVTFPVGRFQEGGSEYVLYSDRNQFRIPDYYRLDIGFNMEGNHKIKKFAHSFWNFSIYNVLGRNNPFSVFFVTENGEIKAFQSSIFAVPVPTLTYNFKF